MILIYIEYFCRILVSRTLECSNNDFNFSGSRMYWIFLLYTGKTSCYFFFNQNFEYNWNIYTVMK